MDSRHTSLLERDSWGKSMKHKAPVFTLALLGALALAASRGGCSRRWITWSRGRSSVFDTTPEYLLTDGA